MKFYNNTKKLMDYSLIILCILLILFPIKATAATKVCSEAYLRDVGAAMINCNGRENQCTANGSGPISMKASANIPEPHKSIIERAASKFAVNPNFIAALYLSEQGNIWKPLEGPYASSRAGASGPFQFMPSTWSGYKMDGNGDGVMDIQNFEDAAFAASKLAATGTNQATPLGELSKPFNPSTLIIFSAVYNWGGGNVQRKTTSDSPITAAPTETQNYMKNIHSLISSDFTLSGHPAYGNPRMPSGQPVAGNLNGTLFVSNSSSCLSDGSSVSLVTDDPVEARNLILSSSRMIWGNYGSSTTQKKDVENCLSANTLISIATIAAKSGVDIFVNALATDHGGCNTALKSYHNKGRAIDIGYYGNNAQGQSRHVEDGDTLYKFLFDNRDVLKINELIWQYPPDGYKCMDESFIGECDKIFNATTMNQHYHHIHVSFN